MQLIGFANFPKIFLLDCFLFDWSARLGRPKIAVNSYVSGHSYATTTAALAGLTGTSDIVTVERNK